jgi:phosphatidate cytidylyltransferase
MQRVLSALILIPIVVAAVLYAPAPLFVGVIAAVSLIALYEFFKIAEPSSYARFKAAGYLAAVAIDVSLYFNNLGITHAVILTVVLALFILALHGLKDLSQAITAISHTFLGVFYTSYLLGLLIPIRYAFSDIHGARYVLFILVIIWAGDTGAYYVGRNLGRRRLAPRISPKKTVEGGIGGLAASALIGYLFHIFWPLQESALTVVALGLVLGLIGQVGDAAESLLKRGAQIKDSSALIPGHGGLLDRIDSLLFAAPAMYLFLAFTH